MNAAAIDLFRRWLGPRYAVTTVGATIADVRALETFVRAQLPDAVASAAANVRFRAAARRLVAWHNSLGARALATVTLDPVVLDVARQLAAPRPRAPRTPPAPAPAPVLTAKQRDTLYGVLALAPAEESELAPIFALRALVRNGFAARAYLEWVAADGRTNAQIIAPRGNGKTHGANAAYQRLRRALARAVQRARATDPTIPADLTLRSLER